MATGPIETHLHRSFNWENAAPGPREGPRGRSANCGNGLFAQCVRLRSEINHRLVDTINATGRVFDPPRFLGLCLPVCSPKISSWALWGAPPLCGVLASAHARRVTLIAPNVRCLLHRIAPVEWRRRPWGRIVTADSRARAMLSIWRCRLCRRSLKPSSPWRRWVRSSSRFSIHTRSSSGFGGARGLCATERSSARNGVKNKAGVAARPLQVEIRIARVIG